MEKRNSVFTRTDYTDKEAEQVILTYPYKRFEGIQMLRHTKTLGVIQVEESVWKQLTAKEKDEIGKICDEKLAAYYDRLK